MIPDWWESLLLVGAAWRVWHLLAFDDIFAEFRRYVTGKPLEWLECPYCAGFWTVVAWWLCWYAFPTGTLVAATPFMLSAGVIAVAKFLSAE